MSIASRWVANSSGNATEKLERPDVVTGIGMVSFTYCSARAT
jgi:hypothetical protein